MSVVDALPDRPLKSSEWEKIKNTDTINDAIPFYGGLANASAFGQGLIPAFVVATDTCIISVIHKQNDDETSAAWSVKEKISQDDVENVDSKMAELFTALKDDFNAQTGFGE